MANGPWDGIVPELELEVYRKAGLGARGGIGKKAALLIIDVQYRSMGESPKPILESMKEYGTSCGEMGWRAIPGIFSVPPRGYEFVKEIAPEPGDLLPPKNQASAFFGTPLAAHLVQMGVDSVVVVGCTTSGCVRGTAVDANAYNYKVVVPEDAVYDRSPTSHAVNLFDIAHKYADVVTVDETIAMLGS